MCIKNKLAILLVFILSLTILVSCTTTEVGEVSPESTKIIKRTNLIPSKETHCKDGVCNLILRTGVDCVVTRDSLTDPDVDCVKYNDTHFEIDVKDKDKEYPIKIYNKTNKVKIDEKESKKLDKEFFKIDLNKEIHIGENSTELILQDADTENFDDGYAWSSASSTEWGARNQMIIGGPDKAIIKFNLSSIPENQQIDNAELFIYMTSEVIGSGDVLEVRAHLVYSSFSWTEGTGDALGNACTGNEYCWDNMPVPETEYQTSYSIANVNDGESNVWKIWDVINQTNYAYGNSYTEISLWLNGTNGIGITTDYTWWNTKEHATSALRPYLNITYSETPVSTPTTAVPTLITIIDEEDY